MIDMPAPYDSARFIRVHISVNIQLLFWEAGMDVRHANGAVCFDFRQFLQLVALGSAGSHLVFTWNWLS